MSRSRGLAHALRVIGLLSVAGAIALSVAAPAAGSSTTPILIEETASQTCGDFAASHGGGQDWQELKIDSPSDGTYGSVTLSDLDDDSFSWTSTIGIDAVYVKGGQAGSYLYVYAPTAASAESFGDTGLTLPNPSNNGISHISFCWDTTNPTPSTAPSSAPSTAPSSAPSPEADTAVVTVIKLIDIDGDPATDDWLPAADWPFTVSAVGGTPTPADLVTGAGGEASTVVAIDDGTADVTIGETLPQDVELLDAACLEVIDEGESGQPVGSRDGTEMTLTVEGGSSYECVFVNTSGEVEALTPPPTDSPSGRGSATGASLPLALLLVGVAAIVITMIPDRVRSRR